MNDTAKCCPHCPGTAQNLLEQLRSPEVQEKLRAALNAAMTRA
jgi:uncharacterized protein YjgD (DUF1641 family)